MRNRYTLSLWLILIGLFLPIGETISQEHMKPPVKLVRYEIVPVGSATQVVELRVVIEAARRHEEIRSIPIVIATGHYSWATLDALESAGAHEVLAKPVQPAKFESILRSMLS